jgi:hypothetical protein
VRILESIDQAVQGRFHRHVIHLTPRYVVDRTRSIVFQRMHPGLPWLNPQAIRVLERELGPTDTGIEWGSGRSTLWLARRTASVRSVESDESWYEHIAGELAGAGVDNVSLIHVDVTEQGLDSYIEAFPGLEDESLSYAFVDGLDTTRERCALRAVRLLSPGGLLIFDNVNFWIPHPTRPPRKSFLAAGIAVTAPSSPLAEQMVELLKDWSAQRTTDGVTETAFWRKPLSAGRVRRSD